MKVCCPVFEERWKTWASSKYKSPGHCAISPARPGPECFLAGEVLRGGRVATGAHAEVEHDLAGLHHAPALGTPFQGALRRQRFDRWPAVTNPAAQPARHEPDLGRDRPVLPVRRWLE